MLKKRIYKIGMVCLTRLAGVFYNNSESSVILFGARNGDYYMDNSRALFEWYVASGRQDFYWMTRSTEVYNLLKRNGLPVARIDSLEGIRLLHQAKFAFYTNRLRDIAIDERAVPKSLKMIFLSHGQSVKNTRLAVNEGVDVGYKKDTLKASAQMAFAISTSPFMAGVQALSNGLQPQDYKITGFPRNDWMLNPPDEALADWNKFTGGHKYSKVILYAPTWRRNEPKTLLFPFTDFDAVQLAGFIARNNMLLLLRPHLQDLRDNGACKLVTRMLCTLSPNIRLATIDDFVEANYLLPFVDALISDYSSIYHDFLLLKRPVYFIPYDLDSFDQVNGFKYPYKENLPGPILDNQQQMIREFDLLLKGVDLHEKRREKLTKMIYTDVEGLACERVATELENLTA